MRVGLVACCLNTPHIRGMGRYVYELLRQSKTQHDLEWRLFGDDPRNFIATPEGFLGEADVFSFRGDRFHLWEQLGLPLRQGRHAVDVMHCAEGSLPWWQPVPTVVTVHDTLAWIARDEDLVSRLYFDRVLPAALAKCAAVITISESSRRDIIARWPALEPKLTVIPHGIADEYLAEESPTELSDLQARLGDTPFLVYVGGPMARKRFDWALEVLRACEMPSLHLVACGFGAGARELAQAALPPDMVPRVHFAPYLSDSELLALYRGCIAVLYPTLYEGFGFPAIEAQAAGAPAIFSAVSSLAELVGPLAINAEPTSLEDWRGAVLQAIAMRPERARRAERARVWASQFSWAASLQAHRAVYSRVLNAQTKVRM